MSRASANDTPTERQYRTLLALGSGAALVSAGTAMPKPARMQEKSEPATVARPGSWSNSARESDMPERTCSAPGCDRPQRHKTFCLFHYGRQKRGYDLLAPPRYRPFWERVDKSVGDDACWPWTGARNHGGYGKVAREKYGEWAAHRVAYRMTYGDIPDGLIVRHRCDNPPCCNPAHLEVGTFGDNTRDAVARGRLLIGEMHPLSRLTWADVREIRRLASNGLPQREIGDRFGVTAKHVSQVVNGRRWKS